MDATRGVAEASEEGRWRAVLCRHCAQFLSGWDARGGAATFTYVYIYIYMMCVFSVHIRGGGAVEKRAHRTAAQSAPRAWLCAAVKARVAHDACLRCR